MTLKYAICGVVLVLSAGTFLPGSWPVSLTAQQPEVVRRILLRQDLPIPNYEVIEIALDLPAGDREGRHTHSGTLVVHILEGTMTFDQEGKATATYAPGDTFAVMPGQIHEGINNGSVTIKVLATLIAPKGQDLTTQVP
jgi:quercetin dioxygenase-like cupin family protein